ncbi:MAG: hypothetical protein Q9195_001161 [Heterodermia aff. obscurata]
MELLGLLASVEAIADGTFKVISLINTIREGGKHRLRLFCELNALWVVLKLVEGNFDSEEEFGDPWLKAICVMDEENGVFDQIGDVLDALKTKVQPKVGLRKAVQTMHMHNDTKALRLGSSDDELKAVLEWTSTLNFLKQQNDFVRQAREGTGAWFLEKQTFQTWVSKDNGILWCPGIPGAGKTYLASIVFEHLKVTHQNDKIAVLIAYCGYNEAKSQSIDNLIAALTKQIIQMQPNVSKELKEMYKSHCKTETFPPLAELVKTFQREIAKFQKCFIIIDALDEILDENKRLQLLEILVNGNANLLITSRYLDSIEELFAAETDCDGCEEESLQILYHCKQCADYGFDLCIVCREKGENCPNEDHYAVKKFAATSIDIKATQSDVRNYVLWRIDHEPRLLDSVTKKKALREEIAATIVQQSSGMFLLARLHMDALATKRTSKAVQETLQNLPTKIKDTYEQAMTRIEQKNNDDDRKMAMNLLLWIAFARRPLTVAEIEHATSIAPKTREIDPDDVVSAKDLTSLCAGLVIIDASNILRLVHFSAQNYLSENRARWFADGDLVIARHCLTYLSFKEFENGPCTGLHEREEFKRKADEYPLLDYCCTYWGSHLSKSQKSTELIAGWEAKTRVNPLHLAAYCGLAAGVIKFLAHGNEVDCRDSMGATPLMYATTGGHATVVGELLRKGANPNLLCNRGRSTLHRAIVAGDIQITRILLEEPGIDLHTSDPSQGDQTPLMLAVSFRRSDILKSLLQKPEVEVNANSGSYQNTALTLAAGKGDADIVRQILNHPEIDVNKRNKLCTALTEAARADYFAIVEMLLDHNADPDLQDGHGGTPLNRAIDHGYVSIVRLLLQRGANKKVLDNFNRTIIHSAAINRRDKALKVLFEADYDVDINTQGTNGRTALHDAAYYNYCSTIEILFANGARTDIHDNGNRSPLGVAKDQNNLEALTLLTKLRKQEILRDENEGHHLKKSGSMPYKAEDTSFLTAAKLGHTQLIQSTITCAHTDHTIDINMVDLNLHSALHYAVQYDHLDVLSALISAENINLNIQDRWQRTPLLWTALYNRYEAASLLLDAKSIDLSIEDHFKYSALEIAIGRKFYSLATLLMTYGAWPRKEIMQNALCAAVMGGGTAQICAKLVRQGGADPGCKNAIGEGPLHLAEFAGNEEAASAIVRLCEERERENT